MFCACVGLEIFRQNPMLSFFYYGLRVIFQKMLLAKGTNFVSLDTAHDFALKISTRMMKVYVGHIKQESGLSYADAGHNQIA